MKHSLSLTLQHLYSFAGNLTWYPESPVPEIIYVDGDSILFTSIESNFSFDHLYDNHPRDANDFVLLSTHLLPRSSTSGSTTYQLLAVDRTDPALPLTYFGNCLMFCFGTITKNELFGEDGIVIAAEVIGKALQTFGKAVLDDCENLFPKLPSIESQRIFGVAGSPRVRSYEVDFGVSLSEHGDHNKGGLEIGIAMKKPQMDVFASLFENTLSGLQNTRSSLWKEDIH
ncbi:hypothetical protein GIB67_037160 [Kingdonia uniflora]|uniref:Uncharacterized protein n=1 Tax=Kingdonia uniflora TaxID=39325 RepID=A0A7J7MRY6_9MAGN|nr:hypothetical protein GIB67_037160 [Kingdonia uniflora]